MLIEVHAVTDNTPMWLNPKSIMMVTFQDDTTTLMLDGGLAMQIIENKAELRGLLDQCTEYESSIIVTQAYG